MKLNSPHSNIMNFSLDNPSTQSLTIANLMIESIFHDFDMFYLN